MSAGTDLAIDRAVRSLRLAMGFAIVAIVFIVLGVGFVLIYRSGMEQKLARAHSKTEHLDAHCRRMKGLVEIVLQDIVNPIPEVANDPIARRKLATAGVFMWNALANLDHVALAPCLRDPVPFGMIAISPPIWACADNDAPCAAHFASIALADFANPDL